MAGVGVIPWWRKIPLPWRRWRMVLFVEAADEIPDRLPHRGAVVVGTMQRPKWIAFDCPCGTGHRVMVNLDQGRRPFWVLREIPLTLTPSIDDRVDGRRCHFMMTRGRVRWAYS